MGTELYPYQKDAINKLKNGSILCGGVGSGKSITALTYYFSKVCGGNAEGEHYIPMNHPLKLFIITTARKRDTLEWESELARFLLSTNKDNTPYEPVVVDSWNNIQKYVAVKGAFFIFDEQRVVGSGAWVKAFLKIAKANQWILLSATPGDTWTDYIPVFIANGFYRNRTQFLREHAVYSMYSKYPKIERFTGKGKLLRYRNEVLVNMDYKKRTVSHKEDVLVSYDRTLYKQIQKNRWDPFKEEPIENISELCYLLRKVSNSDETRMAAVLSICQTKEKVIIFYNFDYELEALRALPYTQGTKVAEWNGHKHEPIPVSKRWVYLVQYAAGAEGWNCTKTDTIIFYSQSYSYKTMVQASGRIDRLNTPFDDLYYYHLRSNSPIDVAIALALRKKQNFNESKFAY